jgi:hypothetical protein
VTSSVFSESRVNCFACRSAVFSFKFPFADKAVDLLLSYRSAMQLVNYGHSLFVIRRWRYLRIDVAQFDVSNCLHGFLRSASDWLRQRSNRRMTGIFRSPHIIKQL